jgi:hypothetical protein
MPIASSISFFDNKGGLNTKASALSLAPNESPDLLNIDLSATGAIASRKGSIAYTTAAIGAAGKIMGLFRLLKSSGAKYLLAAEGGNFYEDSLAAPGDFSTSRGSGYSTSKLWLCAEYSDKLFLANGYDAPLLYAGGAAVTNLVDEPGASLPGAWVGINQPAGFSVTTYGRAERMAAWGIASEPSRVWFSAIQNPLDWSDITGAAGGYNILVLKDNGEAVKAVVPFYDFTVIFKETECALYAGYTAADTSLQKIFPLGTVAPRSVVQVGRDIYWWSHLGPVSMSGTNEYGDLDMASISTKIESEVRRVNRRLEHQIVALHDKDNSRVIWFYPPTGSTVNSAALVFHYDIGAWSKYDNLQAHSALAVVDAAGGNTLYLGRNDGHLHRLGVGTSDAGVAFTSRYLTPWITSGDFGVGYRVPQSLFATDGQPHVNVYYQWDFDQEWTSLGRLSSFVDGGRTWADPGIWDDDTWEAEGGIPKATLLDCGKVLRFKFENTLDASWRVLGWELAVSPRGYR